VNWPNGIKDKNKLRNNPCHFVDILPTLVDLAGGSAKSDSGPPFSGRSLAPVFSKDGSAPHSYLYFNHSNNRAIRVGDSKLIATGTDGRWELYDMATDRCEQHDLASAQPARLKQLAAMWKERDDEFVRVRDSAAPSTRKRMGNAKKKG